MKVVLAYAKDLLSSDPRNQVGVGLLYVAGMAEKAGHEVRIVQADPDGYEQKIQAALSCADVIGFSGTSAELFAIKKTIRHVRTYFTGTVVVGGIGVTIAPDYFDCEQVDAVVVGEGETAFVELLNDVQAGNCKPIYHGEPVQDLDALPYPARHLLEYYGRSLFLDGGTRREVRSDVIACSRGCQFRCTFCSAKRLWPIVRKRSADAIKAELVHMKERHGIQEIRLTDDNVIVNKAFFNEVLQALQEVGFPWRVSIRTRPNSVEMYQAMKDSGCQEVTFGVESFDPKVLKAYDKRVTPADAMTAIANAKSVGMKVRLLMITGGPADDEETYDLNMRAMAEARPDAVSCNTFVPYPGTDIGDNPEKYHILILNPDVGRLNYWSYDKDGKEIIQPTILPYSMSYERYIELVRRMRQGIEELKATRK